MMNRFAAVAAALAVVTAAGAAQSADVDAGKKVFNKCRACHKLEEGKNGVGPSLYGVVGRPVASVEGYNYSDAMKAHAKEQPTWTEDALHTYLKDPKAVVPGTKMAFAGLKNPEDIDNVIAYIESESK